MLKHVFVLLFTLGVILLGSIVPIMQFLYLKFKKKKPKTVYQFSNKLFDAEYSDSNYWKNLSEQFERKNSEEFNKPLP